jgi:hypothetical protein
MLHSSNPESPFLNFLLTELDQRGAIPEKTGLYLDLDETMFRNQKVTEEGLDGTWRPDMPDTIDGLRRRTYGIHLLSSATHTYIDAALDIYTQQFGRPGPEQFDSVSSVRDYNEDADKSIGHPLHATEVRATGTEPLYIDDAALAFNDPTIQHIHVPSELQYWQRPEKGYFASYRD